MSTERSVTVIGCGLMGTALARALDRAGHAVTVWNRTKDRAVGVGGGVHVAEAAAEACREADVVIVSLLDYDVCHEVVFTDEVAEALGTGVLVQLTTGTPTDARTASAWATASGVTYLDAAILGYPEHVATEYATIFFAGEEAAFEGSRDVFAALSPNCVLVGEAIGLAATVDFAILTPYYAATLGFLQAAAICRSEGLPLDALLAQRDTILTLIGGTADATIALIEHGDYTGDQCAMTVHAAAAGHLRRLSREIGIDGTLPGALADRFDATVAAGHGGDDLASVFEVMINEGEGQRASDH